MSDFSISSRDYSEKIVSFVSRLSFVEAWDSFLTGFSFNFGEFLRLQLHLTVCFDCGYLDWDDYVRVQQDLNRKYKEYEKIYKEAQKPKMGDLQSDFDVCITLLTVSEGEEKIIFNFAETIPLRFQTHLQKCVEEGFISKCSSTKFLHDLQLWFDCEKKYHCWEVAESFAEILEGEDYKLCVKREFGDNLWDYHPTGKFDKFGLDNVYRIRQHAIGKWL